MGSSSGINTPLLLTNRTEGAADLGRQEPSRAGGVVTFAAFLVFTGQI